MTSEILPWNANDSILIPAKIKTARGISRYAKQLTPREVKQIIATLDSGHYEMGALFLWQKTMAGLKEQIGSLGMDFVGELLDRNDVSIVSVPREILTDYDALHLAEELGMFSPTQAMRLRNVMQTIAHFSASPAEDEEYSERQMMPEEAIHCLRTCIQSVLGHERLDAAIEFQRFREDLEEKLFSVEDSVVRSLLVSPYFFQRTTLRVILAMSKTAEGAQLQHILANANVIIPALWPNMMRPDRWMIGRAYAEVHAEGRKTAASGLRKALLKVHGFDYVPEDLRSRVFLEAANELQSMHFSVNNFYNEPSAIGALASLGTVIPPSVLGQCVTAVLSVRLGNHWGISWAAQERVKQILSGLGNERWGYYLNHCLPSDNIILDKLTDPNIIPRWMELITQYGLDEIELSHRGIARLVRAGAKNKVRTVETLAKTLNTRLLDKST